MIHAALRAPVGAVLGAAMVCALVASQACAEKPALTEEALERARHELVAEHIAPAIPDSSVVEAMRTVPRHLFVPERLRGAAYEDRPLPIGSGQTVSQPYVVALMTALAGPRFQGARFLEVGTGSGYQAAVLAELGVEVYSIEILPEVATLGERNLKAAGYSGVHLRVGDGYLGWPEKAPFDAILVTCAPDHVPVPLEEQLAEGGRMVIPVGEQGTVQELYVVDKKDGELTRRDVVPVRFVPMTGIAEAGEPAAR